MNEPNFIREVYDEFISRAEKCGELEDSYVEQ